MQSIYQSTINHTVYTVTEIQYTTILLEVQYTRSGTAYSIQRGTGYTAGHRVQCTPRDSTPDSQSINPSIKLTWVARLAPLPASKRT